MSLVNKQKVQDILIGLFQRPTADERQSALRELIARLNYEPVQAPLNVALPEGADPDARPMSVTLLGQGGSDNAFHIIHTHFPTPGLSRVDERAVITSLMRNHPYSLFVFSNKGKTLWHFINVKVANAEKSEDNRDPKLRRLFRRITVGPMEQLRTATERVELLDLEHIVGIAGDLSPLAIQLQHEIAFDVEAVTDQFFKLYKEIFETVVNAITGLRGKEARIYFTQRLFNRLMFIVFIQKKGWLRAPFTPPPPPPPLPPSYQAASSQINTSLFLTSESDYLGHLWFHYESKMKDDSNFYNDRLRRLFFHGLNTPNETNQTGIRGSDPHKTVLQRVIGDVPYLNGGLFEFDTDGTDEDLSIVVPDKTIKTVLHDLFQRFNFTVTESTPLDVEVAVDPEMLGKVFEELVTGRHETGAYYTPKPIVSFMGREAIKGYLQTKLPKESAEAIADFVDDHKAGGLKDPERVLEALKRVTICDPACGSGAYLLGMLHELLDLRACLFASVKLDAPDVYDRKLEIIQNNLYGVDIEQFAINIARLRLWLSLAVDFNGEVAQLPPLPNLDFKIERGDSVCGPDPTGGLQLSLHQQNSLSEFLDKKAAYLKAHHEEKKRLWRDILKVRDKLKSASDTDGDDTGFLWAVEFAEVFSSGGFDVVVANPPYVRMELIKPIKPKLRENFPDVHAERADLYCYFYARAMQLLRPSGIIAFISSNKWLRAGYGKRLRTLLARKTEISTITDFGDLPVFQSASAYPVVFIAQTGKATTEKCRYTAVPSLESPYPDVLAVTKQFGTTLGLAAFGDKGEWLLAGGENQAKFSKMMSTGKPLGDFIANRIYYGVKTGLNEAFIINRQVRTELIEQDKDCKEFIKPLIVGSTIRRWNAEHDGRYLIYLWHGVTISKSSPILKHLRKHRQALEARATDQKWYELQQPQFKYASSFSKTKIVFPDIAKEPRFALDRSGAYLSDTTFMIESDDRFLLGLLNSDVLCELYANMTAQVRGGYLRFKLQYVQKIPIPDVGARVRSEIADLVQKCLDANGDRCEAWEKEIDERVAALYGL